MQVSSSSYWVLGALLLSTPFCAGQSSSGPCTLLPSGTTSFPGDVGHFGATCHDTTTSFDYEITAHFEKKINLGITTYDIGPLDFGFKITMDACASGGATIGLFYKCEDGITCPTNPLCPSWSPSCPCSSASGYQPLENAVLTVGQTKTIPIPGLSFQVPNWKQFGFQLEVALTGSLDNLRVVAKLGICDGCSCDADICFGVSSLQACPLKDLMPAQIVDATLSFGSNICVSPPPPAISPPPPGAVASPPPPGAVASPPPPAGSLNGCCDTCSIHADPTWVKKQEPAGTTYPSTLSFLFGQETVNGAPVYHGLSTSADPSAYLFKAPSGVTLGNKQVGWMVASVNPVGAQTSDLQNNWVIYSLNSAANCPYDVDAWFMPSTGSSIVEIPNPLWTTPSCSEGEGMSGGAVAGIVLGVLAFVGLAAGGAVMMSRSRGAPIIRDVKETGL